MIRKLLALFTVTFASSTIVVGQGTELFFSEYLEGASNNKAIEIYNPTNAPVNLTNYVIYRYNNGSPTPTDSLFLTGTLSAGGVFVVGNPSGATEIINASDTLHTITFFNGDDAMALKKISTGQLIDIIGVIGVDPGTNWVVGTGATSEFTLVRKPSISGGTTNWATGVTEWNVYPQNTMTYLGNHTMTAVLPVKLTSFTGYLLQNQAKLEWKVEEQEGIDTYDIQKSSDGINFLTIASVAVHFGRSSTYQYVDASVVVGTTFYRLKINERQHSSYSRTIHLNGSTKQKTIAVYPTIATNKITLQSNESEILKQFVQIYANNGVLVKSVNINQLPLNIDISDLVKGQYFLKTTIGIQSFIKQ